MVRNGEISGPDVKRAMRRHWWVIPVSIVVCGTIGVLMAMALPKRYTSQTVVLVTRPTVGPKYVDPVSTEDLNHRLSTMQEQILSRSRLEPVIQKFGLYKDEVGKTHIEDLVERLRNTISVSALEAMRGTEDRTLPGFYINVSFNDPQLAQQICAEVTSMFLSQNALATTKQAEGTTSFLSQQLDQAKAALDEQDAKLAKLKKQYMGSLPEESQSNLSLLMTMNSQLEATTQTLSRAQQDKVLNESILTQQLSTWRSMQSSPGTNTETLEQQLGALQDQLTNLESRYTEEHPDVIKTKNQIAELKRRMTSTSSKAPETPAAAAANAPEPPQIQQLRAKLKQDELGIADLTKRQSQIQEQIRQLQGKIQASPMVEEQVKELSRSYQSAQDFYNELLKKRENSAMATDLAHQQEGEQFRVLDPPSLPIKPSFPKKTYFGGGGLGFGLVAALGILYVLVATDRSLYTERDVEISLKLPVLTTVPSFMIAANSDLSKGGATNGNGASQMSLRN